MEWGRGGGGVGAGREGKHLHDYLYLSCMYLNTFFKVFVFPDLKREMYLYFESYKVVMKHELLNK